MLASNKALGLSTAMHSAKIHTKFCLILRIMIKKSSVNVLGFQENVKTSTRIAVYCASNTECSDHSL